MPALAASSRPTRHSLVAEIRASLDRESFPRAIVLVMLLVAGGAAFLTSVVALNSGLTSMAMRYALATAVGYLVFLLLIWLWIAIRRGTALDTVIDLAPDLPLSRSGGERPGEPQAAHHWERSGTGWDDVPVERSQAALESTVADPAAGGSAGSATDGLLSSLDLDEFWWVAIAAVVLGAGIVAVAFVVYSAPLLLAEVALDAALVSTVYRRLRREDAGHWAATALRQTWLSAGTLIVFMGVLGFAFQQLAPDARSIGGVLRHLLAR
jgi:hypothetical protein